MLADPVGHLVGVGGQTLVEVDDGLDGHLGVGVGAPGLDLVAQGEALAFFEPAEGVVHMDVVDTSGSLVNSVLIPISHEDGAYLAEGTFSAPSWGSMLLTFFCLGRNLDGTTETGEGETALGLMTEGQNLAVHPGRELTVMLDGVPDEIKFVIRDRADYEFARDVVLRHALPAKTAAVLFSPVHGVLPAQTLAEWILADRLTVRLQLQAHKYVWGADVRGV